LDCRPNSSTRGCDASLIETLCDLLRAGEAGRANVVDDGKEIIIALGTCGTAHRGADKRFPSAPYAPYGLGFLAARPTSRRGLECPAIFVPVLMRETVQEGAEDGEGKEAYA